MVAIVMLESLRVPARALPNTTVRSDALPPQILVGTKHAIAVQPPVRGVEDDYVVLSDLASGQLVELEFQNGFRRWISVDQFLDDIRAATTQRGGDPGVLTVPASLYASGVGRGGAESPLKQLTTSTIGFAEEFLFDKGAEPAARLAAAELVRRIESKLKPNPGLHTMTDPRNLGDLVLEADLQGKARILLFIHGTASSTEGSFGDLAGTTEWERMRDKFDRTIVALEHNTLSMSPIENALQAARSLPAGAVLNLVTHSRGGLVGELLCLADLKPAQQEQFGEDRQADRKALADLIEILQRKKFVIERFVRVACPSRGTLLASRRLDLYLSVLLGLFSLLPVFQGNIFYKFMEALLKKLIALKADPNEIPGLEAQMPESPLIHLLNRPDLQTRADLAVIAGDAHGGGIFQALGTFALDVFYRKKHDFVVNTDAMYGGIDRGTGGYYFDDRGSGVCHFHYFRNPRTREQINAWLEAKTPGEAGEFLKLAWRDRDLIFPSLRGGERLPVLLYVPGLFGTHLQEGGETIWLDWKHLLPGSLDRLRMDRNVQAGKAVAGGHEDFLTALNASFNVTAFEYDWRKPLAENAKALAERLTTLLDTTSLPVHVLTMSSGSMVLQGVIAGSPDVWKRIRERLGHAAMLGSPAAAARSARAITQGKHKLVRLLSMLDRRKTDEIGLLFDEMPGVREIAGQSAGAAVEGAHWICGRMTEPDRPPDPAWFVDVEPGALTAFRFLADAIRDLLNSGGSDRLDPTPRAPVEADAEAPVLYPSEQDLTDAAFETEPVTGPEPIRIHAYVTHGHLRDAAFPVAVGHYVGDGIVSAEKVLDRQLGGKLSENFRLDLYPGADGTAEVIESPNSDPPGALVIGLGEVGEIKAEKVRCGITTVALRYALLKARSAPPQDECLVLGISALLLGTYGGNALSVRDSVEAVVEGVARANLELRNNKLYDRVRIEYVEFIELYEDLAIQAAHELIELESRRSRESDPVASIIAGRDINVRSGGLFHRPGSPYQAGWWRRVSVVEEAGGLKFTIITDRAGVPFSIEPTQRDLVKYCIDRAVSSARYEEDLARILFDLLLPTGLKEQIRDRANLVFVVDNSTAYYPWEMFAHRDGEKVAPLASRLGLIRQLAVKGTQRQRTSRRTLATVVGVPTVSGGSWPPLPNAEVEAIDVADRLEKAGYDVKRVTRDADPVTILANVLAENRILHLAGHGYFDAKAPDRSGLVIGDGLYLTAAEIGKIEPIPELVFLNCCYLGKIATDRPGTDSPHHLAATIAQKLIEMGVKAVVASGWAVEDAAAKRFAGEFYDAMLNGTRFGEAVLRARLAVYRGYPGTNTWGAYQCYGNPDFSLEVNPGNPGGSYGSAPRPVARREVLDAVRSIASRAVDADEIARTRLLEELSALDRFVFRKEKFADGEVLSEIAHAYSALDDNRNALDVYEKAFSDPESKVPVEAVQHFANILYREAEKVSEGTEHRKLFEKARGRIQWTLDLSPTVERLSLMGSLYKREAKWLMEAGRPDEEVRGMFEKALSFYGEACYPGEIAAEVRQALSRGGDCKPYPALNFLAIEFLLGRLTTEDVGSVDRLAERAEKEVRDGGDFWDRATAVDAGLLRQLVTGEIAEHDVQDELVRRYLRVFAFGTRRQKGSPISQMKFLRDMTAWMKNQTAVDGLSRLISSLEEQIARRS